MSDRIWPVVLAQNVIYLIAGFVLLILAGDRLVETSVKLARRWNVPTSVIAVTIIAAGTSAPELVTSFLAGFKGSGDISVGNVMGSNVFNIFAVGGLSLFLQPKGSVSSTLVSWAVLVFGTALFYFSLLDLSLSSVEAAILLATLALFLLFSFFRERNAEESFENLDSTGLPRTLTFFILSLGGLLLGAELALSGGVALGNMAGLSERVIAITIISAGTGLPELATSVAAAFRGHSEIAIANVIGSNIFNTLAIPGVTASFFSIQVNQQFLGFDFYMMSAATLSIMLLYLFKNPKLRRVIGLFMFLSYNAYVIRLLLP